MKRMRLRMSLAKPVDEPDTFDDCTGETAPPPMMPVLLLERDMQVVSVEMVKDQAIVVVDATDEDLAFIDAGVTAGRWSKPDR